MKKNLILISALFAGSMIVNDGFGSTILRKKSQISDVNPAPMLQQPQTPAQAQNTQQSQPTGNTQSADIPLNNVEGGSTFTGGHGLYIPEEDDNDVMERNGDVNSHGDHKGFGGNAESDEGQDDGYGNFFNRFSVKRLANGEDEEDVHSLDTSRLTSPKKSKQGNRNMNQRKATFTLNLQEFQAIIANAVKEGVAEAMIPFAGGLRGLADNIRKEAQLLSDNPASNRLKMLADDAFGFAEQAQNPETVKRNKKKATNEHKELENTKSVLKKMFGKISKYQQRKIASCVVSLRALLRKTNEQIEAAGYNDDEVHNILNGFAEELYDINWECEIDDLNGYYDAIYYKNPLINRLVQQVEERRLVAEEQRAKRQTEVKKPQEVQQGPSSAVTYSGLPIPEEYDDGMDVVSSNSESGGNQSLSGSSTEGQVEVSSQNTQDVLNEATDKIQIQEKKKLSIDVKKDDIVTKSVADSASNREKSMDIENAIILDDMLPGSGTEMQVEDGNQNTQGVHSNDVDNVRVQKDDEQAIANEEYEINGNKYTLQDLRESVNEIKRILSKLTDTKAAGYKELKNAVARLEGVERGSVNEAIRLRDILSEELCKLNKVDGRARSKKSLKTSNSKVLRDYFCNNTKNKSSK